MKGCELCSYPARIYCESDRASLCSDCDEKVHSANFLVAKHSRNLLCHVCQSPTPWNASGTKLGPTVSVCDGCVSSCCGKQGRRGGERVNGDDETDDDFEGEDDDEEEDVELVDDEEEGENQVVPWSSTPPPPPAASSSSSEEECFGRISAMKRTRQNADLDSDDEIGCTSSRFDPNIAATMATSSRELENDEADSSGFPRSPKLRRPNNEAIQSERVKNGDEGGSRSVATIVNSLRKFQQNTIYNDDNASDMVLGIYRLSRDPTAV